MLLALNLDVHELYNVFCDFNDALVKPNEMAEFLVGLFSVVGAVIYLDCCSYFANNYENLSSLAGF